MGRKPFGGLQPAECFSADGSRGSAGFAPAILATSFATRAGQRSPCDCKMW